ncbi:SDR family oxidoreductase [Phreatobacter aquaticus]|uniref:SDR family oxidoreductase n=1 Tax=Phreatobacter aquaticus TaxID=2570229 RepID=A0A4D7QLY2_9HYPH|nr:SDR family oxidoreductase [Phreatobacter aquaticus]QCK87541.1 SDR family oxidoreductase [Phreatobacter aquaticus]
MKTALVTGGTRGIGEGIARALALAGYRVTACGLTDEEIGGFRPQDGITTRKLDVTNDASVAAALAGIDRLDLLVNCAGIIQRAGKEFEIDAFRLTLEVNLVGTMRMCVAAKSALAAAEGSIVNTASMLTFQGSPFVPGYAASKGGIGQLTKSLAAAWAAENIRVNAIAPGWIATELTRPLVEDAERAAPILARTPMNRWGVPDDLGGVVVFLASDAARFMTGAILPVDGGFLAV